MNGFQAIDHAPECRREAFVGFGGICEYRVPTDVRTSEYTEHDISRGLSLVADVLMPECRGQLVLEELCDLVLVSIPMDDVEGWKAFDGARDGLVAQFAEVGHEVLLKLRASVEEVGLVSKDDDLALHYQER